MAGLDGKDDVVRRLLDDGVPVDSVDWVSIDMLSHSTPLPRLLKGCCVCLIAPIPSSAVLMSPTVLTRSAWCG